MDVTKNIESIIKEFSVSLAEKDRFRSKIESLIGRFEEEVLTTHGLPDEGLAFYQVAFESDWFLNTDMFENLLIDIRSSDFVYSEHQKLDICKLLVSNATKVKSEDSGLVLLDFLEIFLKPKDAFKFIKQLHSIDEFMINHKGSFIYVFDVLRQHNKSNDQMVKKIDTLVANL